MSAAQLDDLRTGGIVWSAVEGLVRSVQQTQALSEQLLQLLKQRLKDSSLLVVLNTLTVSAGGGDGAPRRSWGQV
jgi:hypothetical protein